MCNPYSEYSQVLIAECGSVGRYWYVCIGKGRNDSQDSKSKSKIKVTQNYVMFLRYKMLCVICLFRGGLENEIGSYRSRTENPHRPLPVGLCWREQDKKWNLQAGVVKTFFFFLAGQNLVGVGLKKFHPVQTSSSNVQENMSAISCSGGIYCTMDICTMHLKPCLDRNDITFNLNSSGIWLKGTIWLQYVPHKCVSPQERCWLSTCIHFICLQHQKLLTWWTFTSILQWSVSVLRWSLFE